MIGPDEIAKLAELYDRYANAIDRNLRTVCKLGGNSKLDWKFFISRKGRR